MTTETAQIEIKLLREEVAQLRAALAQERERFGGQTSERQVISVVQFDASLGNTGKSGIQLATEAERERCAKIVDDRIKALNAKSKHAKATGNTVHMYKLNTAIHELMDTSKSIRSLTPEKDGGE